MSVDIRKAKRDLANTILLGKSLNLAARMVGWYIADHINTKRGYAWPPQETIARDLGITAQSSATWLPTSSPEYFAVTRGQQLNFISTSTSTGWVVLTEMT
jgi:hypothetical protein